MQTNTVQTLIDYVKDLTGQTNASNAKVVRALNFAVDHYSYLRITSSGSWRWDSRNQGDISRVTATVTNGKASIENELLALEHVERLENGKYITLHPANQREYSEPLETVFDGSSAPSHYSIEDRTLRLYPQGTATVRLTYSRVHPRYTVDDLTANTGVSPVDEEYIALYAADRLMIGSNDPSRTQIRNELTVKQQEIKDMASKQDRDSVVRLKPRISSAFKNKTR